MLCVRARRVSERGGWGVAVAARDGPDVVEPCGLDRDEVVFGYPGRPVVLEHVERVVLVEHLAERVLVDDIGVVGVFKNAGCYPWLAVPCEVTVWRTGGARAPLEQTIHPYTEQIKYIARTQPVVAGPGTHRLTPLMISLPYLNGVIEGVAEAEADEDEVWDGWTEVLLATVSLFPPPRGLCGSVEPR